MKKFLKQFLAFLNSGISDEIAIQHKAKANSYFAHLR